MMLPLSSSIEFTVAADLAIALALGTGFGFALERAGFGSARKLTAVFYLYDMAVVKVMFTAIVTAMTGLAVLAAVGMLDLAELYIEPTSMVAQVVGGLVFGTGFIVGGYCPGTSIAAIATGRKDGIAFALGMLAGVMAYVGTDAGHRRLDQGEHAGRDDAAVRDRAVDGLVRARVHRVPAVRRLGHEAARRPVRASAPGRLSLTPAPPPRGAQTSWSSRWAALLRVPPGRRDGVVTTPSTSLPRNNLGPTRVGIAGADCACRRVGARAEVLLVEAPVLIHPS